MTTFITIIFVIVALMMVLSILLQAGKGGGLGSALGGGASQSVFGGGGSGDFMAKLTQGFAATFMICAMYLAYASAHAGSEFLQGEDTGRAGLLGGDEEINYEFIGSNPQPLPTPDEGKIKQAKASTLVPAQTEAPSDATPTDNVEAPTDNGDAAAPTPSPEPAVGGNDNADADRGDSPDSARGDSPQSGNESLQNPPVNGDSLKAQGGNNPDSADDAKPGE